MFLNSFSFAIGVFSPSILGALNFSVFSFFGFFFAGAQIANKK
jgi:hypothetical protein